MVGIWAYTHAMIFTFHFIQVAFIGEQIRLICQQSHVRHIIPAVYSLLKLTQLIWRVSVMPVGFNKNWFQAKHFFAISCFPWICMSDASDRKQSDNTFTYSISTFAFLFYRRELIANLFDIVFLRGFHFFKCNVFKRTLTVRNFTGFGLANPKLYHLCIQT